jgi:hypothetical protein
MIQNRKLKNAFHIHHPVHTHNFPDFQGFFATEGNGGVNV